MSIYIIEITPYPNFLLTEVNICSEHYGTPYTIQSGQVVVARMSESLVSKLETMFNVSCLIECDPKSAGSEDGRCLAMETEKFSVALFLCIGKQRLSC